MNLRRLRYEEKPSVQPRVLGLSVLLLLALAFVLSGCKAVPARTKSPQEPAANRAGDEGLQEAEGAALPERQLSTVGFTDDGHAFKGNPDAAVIIEEFSSFQCPYCVRYFTDTYPDLLREYVDTGKVMYVFRDFPLSGQPQSPQAAEAARCAGDVAGAQAFWDMHDRLFAGQRDWSGNADAAQIFKDYAAELGIDQSAFDECLDTRSTSGFVQADADEGKTRGVRGTPSFFINGEVFVGAQPMSAFSSVIDAALAGESITTVAESGGSQETGAEDAPSADLLVPTPAVFAFEREGADDAVFALGDPQAPVTVVEFTDFQCPYCAAYAQQTWPLVKERFVDTGRVYYVFKDFPLLSIHPQAAKAHEAARCAADMGGDEAFWTMHDRLFEGQEDWSGKPEPVSVFNDFAAELGLDRAAFSDCLDNGDNAAAVQADVQEALGLGLSSTPTFFADGYPFSGALPVEFFDQIVTLAEDGQLRDAIAMAIASAQAEQEQAAQPRPTMAPADVPLRDAPIMGDPDAPVTIVEYSDYQCPFCARHFQETMPQLVKTYVDTGKARYVFKDFPLTSIHPEAPVAHEAARCAREIGGDEAYWDMHDRLFESQEKWAGNPQHAALFKTFAADLGLDSAVFDECLVSGRYASAIQADVQEGAGFGVTGTPAFYINGQPLSGAQPYGVFVQVIDALLAEQ